MIQAYIDNKEIKATWGLTPIYEKFYSGVMQFPDVKDKVSNDFEDKSGTEDANTAGYLKAPTPTLSFGVDTYEHYVAFMTYITSVDTFTLTCSTFGSVKYEYLSTSEYDDTGITFSIKVRERNFNDR